MSNTALQSTDGGVIGGTTAAGAAPAMPLDPDNHNPVRGPELVQTAGRMNTVDMHMLAHKFRLDLIKWTPTQLPGTILGNWKNHPNIHPFTRLIANHYLYWAGSFGLTFSICGSGLVGGRLRFIRVPPHISDEQIRNYTVNDLSYFDGFDLDPKSLLTITIPFEDINRQKMHAMSDDLSNPDAFGSRILVIVYGQLQAQIGDNNGLSVIVEVEMLQDFVISTFVPKMLNTPVNDYSQLDFGGTLSYGGRYVDTIRTYPGTQRVVTTGFNRLRATGGAYRWAGSETATSFIRYASHDMIVPANQQFVDTLAVVKANSYTKGVPGQWAGIWKNNTDVDPSHHYIDYNIGSETEAPVEGKVTFITPARDSTVGIYWYGPLEDEGAKFAPFNNERILYFNVSVGYPSTALFPTTKYAMYPALQCEELGNKLSEFPPLGPNEAVIFSIHDTSSGAVLTFAKLYPEGIFTTTPGTDALVLPSNVSFKYNSIGLKTDIIPVQTPAMRESLRVVMKEAKRALRKAPEPEQ